EAKRRQVLAHRLGEAIGKTDEGAAEREVRVGEIRIEAHRLPRVPLRALRRIAGTREPARLSERHGNREIRVRGGEALVEGDGALEMRDLGVVLGGDEAPADGAR